MDSIVNSNDNYYYGAPSDDYTRGDEVGLTIFFVASIAVAGLVLLCRVGIVFSLCKRCTGEYTDDDDNDNDNDNDNDDGHHSPHEESSQYATDRVLAEALQRHMDNVECERELAARRKERRQWYEYYLKPWTMTVKQSDLFYGHRKTDSSSSSTEKEEEEDGTIMVQTTTASTSTSTSSTTNSTTTPQSPPKDGDHEIEEIEKGDDRLRASQFTVCHKPEEDDTADLYLKLQNSGRCVDANCAFCMDDYEAGDKVVYSDNLHCSHAFHKECLMTWLSKGKKRCPVCRHWFVPGQRIDEQKVAHGAAWCRALGDMEAAEEADKKQCKVIKQTPAAEPLNVHMNMSVNVNVSDVDVDPEQGTAQLQLRSRSSIEHDLNKLGQHNRDSSLSSDHPVPISETFTNDTDINTDIESSSR